MGTYKRRHTKSGSFVETGQGLRAALTQQQKRDEANIQGIERLARSHQRVEDKRIDSLSRSFSLEYDWGEKLQSLENKIHNNKTRALAIRSDREVEALKGQADEYMRQSKMWSGVAQDFGQALAKNAGKIYEQIETSRALKNYTAPEFDKTFFGENADAQTSFLATANEDMFKSKDFNAEEKANTIKLVTSESSHIQEGIYAQDWIDNIKVITASTKRDSIKADGRSIWNEHTARNLLLTRAHIYLRKFGIEPDSEAGFKILKSANDAAGSEIINLEYGTRARNDHAELTVGGQSLRAAIKNGKKEEIAARYNAMILIAQGAVIKDGNNNLLPPGEKGHNMSLPEAAEYVIPYILEANPDMTWEDIEVVLGNTHVPLVGKYKHLAVDDEKIKKHLETKYPALKEEGNQLLPEVRTKAIEDYKVSQSEKAPTWSKILQERGYTEIVKNKYIKESEEDGQTKTKIANDAAKGDVVTLRKRILDPNSKDKNNNPNHINLNDYSKGGDREQLLTLATSPGTHSTVKKFALEQLSYDPQRQSVTVAEERYRAALFTADQNDDMYWFSKMSEENQKRYFPSHSALQEAFVSQPDMKDSVTRELSLSLKKTYGNAYNKERHKEEIDRLSNTATQQFWNYYLQLSDKENTGYEPNISKRKNLALQMVQQEIIDGQGIWAREEVGKGGNLKVKWTHQSNGLEYNSDDQEPELKDLPDKYNPITIKEKVTEKTRGELLNAAVTGNAENVPIPDIVLKIASKYHGQKDADNKPITIRTIINDILRNTETTKDMELTWPTGPDDKQVIKTKNSYKYIFSPTANVNNALEYLKNNNLPLMREELRDIYQRRFLNVR